jgi:hypothetical protein
MKELEERTAELGKVDLQTFTEKTDGYRTQGDILLQLT